MVHRLLGIDPQTITVAKLQSHGDKGSAKEKEKSRNGEYDDADEGRDDCGVCQR